MRRDTAFHHAHKNNGATINVEPGIENPALEWIFPRCPWARNALHNGLEHIFHADAAFRTDQQRVMRRNGKNIFDLFFHEIGLRAGRSILLMTEEWSDYCRRREMCSRRFVLRRPGWRRPPVRRLRMRKARANFVGEIDVTGRVDQIQTIGFPSFRFVVQTDLLL